MHPATSYSIATLAERLGVSTDTVSRMEVRGDLPPPFRSRRLGGGRGRCVVRWDRATIERHISAQAAGRAN